MDILESMSITKYIQRTYGIVPPCLNDQSGTAWNLYNYDGYIPTNYILLGDDDMTVYFRAHTMSLSQMKYRINLALALGVGEDGSIAMERVTLSANPLSRRIAISYSLPLGMDVSLNIYDIVGRHVATVFEGSRTSGSHEASWSPTADGVYFVRLATPGETLTSKVVILK